MVIFIQETRTRNAKNHEDLVAEEVQSLNYVALKSHFLANKIKSELNVVKLLGLGHDSL